MFLQHVVLNYFLEKSIEILDNSTVGSDIMEEKVRPAVPAREMLWDLSPEEEFGAKHGTVWL